MKTESTWVSTNRWGGGAWSRGGGATWCAPRTPPPPEASPRTPPPPPPPSPPWKSWSRSRSHFLRPNQRLGWNKERDTSSLSSISTVRSPIVRTASELWRGSSVVGGRRFLLPPRTCDFQRRSNGVIHSPRELPCYAGGHGPRQPQPQGERRPQLDEASCVFGIARIISVAVKHFLGNSAGMVQITLRYFCAYHGPVCRQALFFG